MTWNNPTTNLWYTAVPTPGTIVFDGTYYNLYIPALGDSYKYSPTTLDGAQKEYATQATHLIAKSITLVPYIPSLSLPEDGQTIGIATVLGAVAIGIWSSSNQNVSVLAQTIPVSDIATWSPIPTLG
jgi:hypothetical protein